MPLPLSGTWREVRLRTDSSGAGKPGRNLTRGLLTYDTPSAVVALVSTVRPKAVGRCRRRSRQGEDHRREDGEPGHRYLPGHFALPTCPYRRRRFQGRPATAWQAFAHALKASMVAIATSLRRGLAWPSEVKARAAAGRPESRLCRCGCRYCQSFRETPSAGVSTCSPMSRSAEHDACNPRSTTGHHHAVPRDNCRCSNHPSTHEHCRAPDRAAKDWADKCSPVRFASGTLTSIDCKSWRADMITAPLPMVSAHPIWRHRGRRRHLNWRSLYGRR